MFRSWSTKLRSCSTLLPFPILDHDPLLFLDLSHQNQLKEAFAKYGPVKAIFVLKPSDGKRGCAFIEFERAKDAEVSVTKMDGKKLCGHRLRVEMSCDGNPQGARNFKCMCYLCKRHREEQSKSAVDQAESRWGLFLRVALKFVSQN